jgi:EAL domain-containing protein (putative c-di-GMP-specific phosphodiesterase class I)
VLADIRKLGVRVAIDDFGTGYSSLSSLRSLPVDVVKLDRGFLDEQNVETQGAGFLGAIISLAHAAGTAVVQEGIETQAQLEMISAAPRSDASALRKVAFLLQIKQHIGCISSP